MKLFIYTNSELAPFKDMVQPIGDYKKIIISNHPEQIKQFTNENGIQIKQWLLQGITDYSDNQISYIPPNNGSLFFVPLEMKDTFMKLLDKLFKNKWVKNDNESQPSAEELGLVGKSQLSEFCDNIKTQEILTPEEDDVNKIEAKKQLLELLQFIADDPNEIDAVLISTYDGEKIRVPYSSEPKKDRTVHTDVYATKLRDLITFLEKTEQVNPEVGLFDYVMFQYKKSGNSRGGIIHLTHLPEYDKYTFLIFISATEEGIEMLELYRKRNLEKIKELLNTLIGY